MKNFRRIILFCFIVFIPFGDCFAGDSSSAINDTATCIANITFLKNILKNSSSVTATYDTLKQMRGNRRSGQVYLRDTSGRPVEAAARLLTFFISGRLSGNLIAWCTGDRIWYASIESCDRSVECIYKDSLLFNKYVNEHYSYYGHRPDDRQIEEDFRSDLIFGSCGVIFDYESPMELETDSLVAARDTTTLCRWLCSVNPELKAYGLDGLRRLSRENFRLSHSMLRLMLHVAKLDTDYFSCRGCVTNIPRPYRSIIPPWKIRWKMIRS